VLEQFTNIEIGQDCLEPGLKQERIRLKALALEGKVPETDDDILREAANPPISE
jgi:hypothetical protein